MFDRFIDFLLQWLNLFRFWEVVDQYNQGLLLRLGKAGRVLEPGLHFRWPFGIDRVIEDQVVPRVHRLPAQTVTLRDGSTVVVEPIVTFLVKDFRKFICEVENAEGAILDTVAATVRRRLASSTWEVLVDGERSENLEEDMTKAAKSKGRRWGIEILQVAFASLAKAKTIRLIGGP